MFNRRSLIAVAVAGSALASSHSFALPEPKTVGMMMATDYTLEGRIAAVDTNARTVTITSADGTKRMLNVDPRAANITSTKGGDNVVLGVQDSRTFVLLPPGAASAAIAVETGQNGARASPVIANWLVV